MHAPAENHMPEGQKYASLLDQFAAAIQMARDGEYAAAVPLLEGLTFQFAPTMLAYARLRASGAEVAEFIHQGETFRFQMHPWYMGIDMFHAEGKFYEAQELEYLRTHVPPGGVMVDVGANTGNHTVYLARFLCPRLIIPVEPIDVAADLIRANAELNNATIDERGLGVAASNEPGTLEMAIVRDMMMAKVNPHAQKKVSVRAVRLDDLIPEKVDFLKIDVEGFEMNVLEGARRIVAEGRPQIMLEATEETRDPLMAYLAERGYERVAECRNNLYANIFFRHKGGRPASTI
jgi:FkbM family methyltransferase